MKLNVKMVKMATNSSGEDIVSAPLLFDISVKSHIITCESDQAIFPASGVSIAFLAAVNRHSLIANTLPLDIQPVLPKGPLRLVE